VLSLPIVSAYHDRGSLVTFPTRWCPHKVDCLLGSSQGSRAQETYAVKYVRNAESAAAVISEVVCHALFELLGLRVLSAALIEVNPTFARSCSEQGKLPEPIMPGFHFGTLFHRDLAPGPTEWDQLVDPTELIQIWCADCWVMNIDRMTYGNLMMEPGEGGRWHLIPVDQTDCFLGSTRFQDGSYLQHCPKHGPAPYLPFLDQVFLDYGNSQHLDMIRKIRKARTQISSAVARVPSQWWQIAGINPQSIVSCLSERAGRVKDIVEEKKWSEVTHATRGGLRFDV
jgi:HipA-like protein